MPRPSTQEIEKYYFSQFQRDFAIPGGEIKYSDKPDVIIYGENTTGIEITNFFISSGEDPASEQRQRERRNSVLELAQKIYEETATIKIELSVGFEPERPIHKTKKLALAIANLAKRIQKEPTGKVSPLLYQEIPQLNFLYINTTEYPNPKWRTTQSYTVPNLLINRLNEIVIEKSQKLQEYQPCDSYWLLVVIDLMDFAQDQNLEW